MTTSMTGDTAPRPAGVDEGMKWHEANTPTGGEAAPPPRADPALTQNLLGSTAAGGRSIAPIFRDAAGVGGPREPDTGGTAPFAERGRWPYEGD